MTLPFAPKTRSAPLGLASTRAFTLIELLTVIAIIGILAAILIPTVGRVRDSARSAQCTSNMRQVGMAAMAYANDNRGATPSAVGAGRLDAGGRPLSWYLQIGLYFGVDYSSVDKTRNALRLLTCPSSVRSASGERDVPWNGFNDANWPFISDFGINFAVNNPNYQGGRVILTRFDAPRNPANTPLLAELVYQNNFVAATFSAARPASDAAAFQAGQNQRFTQRHGGGGNVLFFDGHVERLSYNAFAERATRGGMTAVQFVEGL
jgi:prepilin-type processing-associated H-X9-DG protein/prepilin-type N-terminal cleavage/methylation domain-containing protein